VDLGLAFVQQLGQIHAVRGAGKFDLDVGMGLPKSLDENCPITLAGGAVNDHHAFLLGLGEDGLPIFERGGPARSERDQGRAHDT
jgi:hypothetical protein